MVMIVKMLHLPGPSGGEAKLQVHNRYFDENYGDKDDSHDDDPNSWHK